MTEYRWYFGSGRAGEWLKFRPGTYSTTFWKAFSKSSGGMSTIYIYDEYDNLLYVLSDAKPIFKRLAARIKKQFEPNRGWFVNEPYHSDPADLYDHLHYLNIRSSPKFNEAVEMVERAIVEKAKKMRRAA